MMALIAFRIRLAIQQKKKRSKVHELIRVLGREHLIISLNRGFRVPVARSESIPEVDINQFLWLIDPMAREIG